MEKRRLQSYEEQNGLIIGSIVLRALEGEELIIVKPEYVNERDVYSVDSLINSLKDGFNYSYGIEVEVIEEDKLTEEHKNSSLIVIGYPEKSSIIKEMSSDLPIDLSSDTIEINKISIKNDGVSGMFISKNPYNEDYLSLIIFLADEDLKDISNLQGVEVITVEGGSETTYIYNDIIVYKYNPLYTNNNVQFIMNVEGVEINGLYR